MKKIILAAVIVMFAGLLPACEKNSEAGNTKVQENATKSIAVDGEDENAYISTAELIETALEYVKDEPMTVDLWEQAEAALNHWIKNCDAVSELVDRDDYAELIMDIYIDSELPPYETGGDNLYRFKMMEFEEVMLSQDSACRQLSEEQRAEVVKKVIYNAQKRTDKAAYVLHYSNAFFVNLEWQGTDNAWYNAIKEMDRTQFSNEENQYIDNFYSRCDGTPQTVESHSE